MKTNKFFYILLLGMLCFGSTKAEKLSIDGTLDFDCSAKLNPGTFNGWDDAKMTFANGIMTMKNDGTEYNPWFEVAGSSRSIIGHQQVSIIVHTSAIGKKLKVELFKKDSHNNLGKSILIPLNVSGASAWELITVTYPEDPAYVMDDCKPMALSLREADGVTFATGYVHFDRILIGGTINPATTVFPAVPADPTPPVVVPDGPVFTYDCASKPSYAFDWSWTNINPNPKITFPTDMPGIMKVSPAYVPFAPDFELPNSIDLTTSPNVIIRIKTSAEELNSDLSIRPIGILFRVWKGDNIWDEVNMRAIWKPITKSETFQDIKLDIPTSGFTPNNIKRFQFRFIQQNDVNFAAGGDWYVDNIAFGVNLITTKLLSTINQKITLAPVSSELIIVNGADAKDLQVIVYDVAGKKMLNFSNTTQLNISTLSKGVYVANIMVAGVSSRIKFMKK